MGAALRSIFITATDTGVGKTYIACMLLRALAAAGARAVGMKPVASGIASGKTHNEDVAALMVASNVSAPIDAVNPYSFQPAIAPHIAARHAHLEIDLEIIAHAYQRLAANADVVVVEGAGGALTPLSERTDMLDIARRLQLPVLMVVGVRLGCINHALLTASAIDARGLSFGGWIANRIDPAMAAADENIATLRARIPAPLVAGIGWQAADSQSLRSMIEFCGIAALPFATGRM